VFLFDIADRFASLNHSDVTFDNNRCLHSLYRFSECEACYNICPGNAITQGKTVTLDSAKCQTCLACLTICPVGAFSADDSVSPLMRAVTHLEGNSFELMCDRNPKSTLGISTASTGIRVHGCLAGLGSGTYLALVASGHEHITVRMDACPNCDWKTLHAQVERQVTRAKQLLEAWGKAESIIVVSELNSQVERPVWDATNPPVSRRDLFRNLTHQGQATIARIIQDEKTQSDHRPGRDRQRLLGAITQFPAPLSMDVAGMGEMGFATLLASENCVACGTCARACPTRALQFVKTENDTAFTLSLSVKNCIACDICAHVCTSKTLKVDHYPTFPQVFDTEMLILRQGGLIKCEQCGTLIASRPGVRLCQFCDFRQAHPVGSMQGPGLNSVTQPAAEKKID
jgi:ferredoxin